MKGLNWSASHQGVQHQGVQTEGVSRRVSVLVIARALVRKVVRCWARLRMPGFFRRQRIEPLSNSPLPEPVQRLLRSAVKTAQPWLQPLTQTVHVPWLLRRLRGHTKLVSHVALSADGTRAVVGVVGQHPARLVAGERGL